MPKRRNARIPSKGNKPTKLLHKALTDTAEVDGLCETVIKTLLDKQGLQASVNSDASLCIKKMLFITLALRDFNSIQTAIPFATTSWARRYQIRGAVTQMYEIGNDLPGVLDAEFYEACNRLGVTDDDVNSIKAATKTLSKFRKAHSADFKKIRVTIGAHRDHDPALVMRTIDSIDQTVYLKIISSALTNMVQLQRSLISVYSRINETNETTHALAKTLLKNMQDRVKSIEAAAK